MNMLRTALLGALVLLAGCDRKKDPVLERPSSATTGVTLQCPQYESRSFPEGRIYVLVMDQSGQPLTNFKIGNFSVIDNGDPTVLSGVRPISPSIDPLSIVLVMDRSGSMYGQPTVDVNAAAKQFIDLTGPADAIEIIDFASTAAVSIGFTTNKGALKSTIDGAEANGMTALFDAIGLAADELQSRGGRKCIVAMTDGYENASQKYASKESVSDAVNRAGIAANVVGLGSSVDDASLDFIAVSTNGRFLKSPTSAQMSAQFAYIFTLLQNMMVLDYRSRENRTIGEVQVFLNYGDLTGSCRRRYGG